MEVPSAVIQKILSTNSSDIRWVDASEGLEWSPSFVEWADANCGQFSETERNMESKLESQESRGSALSVNDQMLLKLVKDKDEKHMSCLSNMQTRSKEELPAP
jgi:hypothetical protein